MSTGSTAKFCPAGTFTKLSESPTWGFIYIWAATPVHIKWKRYSSGVPWYMEGSQNLVPGKNTVWHGGPSGYCRIDVNPSLSTTLSWG
jgi:hypothetical protein